MVDTSARLAPGHLEQLRRIVPRRDRSRPTTPAYDDARRLWNAIHDRRPAVIVRPTSADEVADRDPVRARARPRDRRPVRRPQRTRARRSRTAGSSSTCPRCAASRSSPTARTARANGGALLGELDVAAQAHGLVCPIGVVGHTGVAGLTLGGGIGRLQRNFGLTIDNLAAVELVTADGRLVRATETEEPELFWGLRGAGWNFGIATAFEFRLQPFGPDLHRGVLTFPATPGPGGLGRLPRLRAAGARRGRGDLRDRAGRARTRATPTTSSAGRSSTSPGTTAALPTTPSATRPGSAPGRSR